MADKNFGETIRIIRQSKEILLRQVAAALEVDTAMISKIEKGERKSQKEQVGKLAAVLNEPEEKLMVLWLSDRLMEYLKDEPLANKALKFSEKRINSKQ